MNWLTICLFFLITYIGPFAFSNELTSLDQTFKVTAKPNNQSYSKDWVSSKIQICSEYQDKTQCETFPVFSKSTFKGTVSDWGYFFNRCSNFDQINNMHDITLALSTLILIPQLGITKTILAEIGVSAIGGAPYPVDIKKEGIKKAAEMVYYILKNGNKRKSIASHYLLALQKILSTCSTLFESDYQNRIESKCMKGCHEIGPKSIKDARTQTKQSHPILTNFQLNTDTPVDGTNNEGLGLK